MLSTAFHEPHARAHGISHSNVLGPRYLAGAPLRPDGNIVDVFPDGATALELSGRVYDAATNEPVPDAMLDVWQADHLGEYDRTGFNLRGLVPVGEDGRYVIKTVVPADYVSHIGDTIADLYDLLGRHTYRAAHVHMKVVVGGREVLTTQVFRSDSPRLDTDLVVGIVRPELVSEMVPSPPGSGEPWRMAFDIPVAVPPAAGDGGQRHANDSRRDPLPATRA
jgi:protocatechuate 3,4-dioxygenase beta subunit